MNIRLAALFLWLPFCTAAQADNDIQVNASPITDKGITLVELHTNYTLKGIKGLHDPSVARYLNKNLEITHGLDGKFEIGFCVFTTFSPGGNYHFQGGQVRPRYSVPEKAGWPIGASLSVEFGFFRPVTDSAFVWQGEIGPIIDKEFNRWYFAFNPNMDFTVSGNDKQFGLAPQFKTMYTIREKVGIGFEYYASLGAINNILPGSQQEHLLGPALDLFLHPDWKICAAHYSGLTPGSLQSVVKLHLGYSFAKRKTK
jgi:hypothetical protein